MAEQTSKPKPFPSVFTRLLVVIAASTLALAACGDDDGGGSTAPSDGGEVDAGSGDGEAAGEAWTDEDFERLVAIEIDGYSLENGDVSEYGNASATYLEENPSGPVALSALVTYTDCDPFNCTDLSVELDEERRANIRSLLPSLHIENPELVEEVGPVELAGRTVLAIYFRSFVEQDDGSATALSYRAITHDGTNLVTVQVSPDFYSAGGLADSAEELAARMGPAEGAAVAEDILTALSSELG